MKRVYINDNTYYMLQNLIAEGNAKEATSIAIKLGVKIPKKIKKFQDKWEIRNIRQINKGIPYKNKIWDIYSKKYYGVDIQSEGYLMTVLKLLQKANRKSYV